MYLFKFLLLKKKYFFKRVIFSFVEENPINFLLENLLFLFLKRRFLIL